MVGNYGGYREEGRDMGDRERGTVGEREGGSDIMICQNMIISEFNYFYLFRH